MAAPPLYIYTTYAMCHALQPTLCNVRHACAAALAHNLDVQPLIVS